jgi:hypothetical protein
MGVAYYIILNGKIDNFDSFVNGKAIAKHYDYLNEIANKLKVKPLAEFYSEDPEFTVDFLVSHGMPKNKAKKMAKPINWSDPSECLITVQALIQYVSLDKDLTAVIADYIIRDLKQFETVLLKASEYCIKFYLAIDF